MNQDPFEYLGQAGDHIYSWILLYGPLTAGGVIALVLSIVIYFKRQREQAKLEEEYKRIPEIDTPIADTKTPSGPPVKTIPPTKLADREAEEVEEIREQDQQAWLTRLYQGLSRTRQAIESSFSGIFSGKLKLDESLLERIHEVLYRADVGVKTADRLIEGIRNDLHGQDVDWQTVQSSLANQARKIFSEIDTTPLNSPEGPLVILIVGVNGAGKTTTIGKLAARFQAAGKSVILCAADTFRAAAIDQLQVWGDRLKVPVIKQQQGADPASVAFDGVQAAKARNVDILIIDTAGRLHSKSDLMAELAKINRSIGKDLPGAPHETWLVLDATTGQNAVQQCKAFNEVTKLTGLIMTKLDGTAKGGVIIGIADQFKLPIRFIGVGEKAADLREFSGAEYVDGLLTQN